MLGRTVSEDIERGVERKRVDRERKGEKEGEKGERGRMKQERIKRKAISKVRM